MWLLFILVGIWFVTTMALIYFPKKIYKVRYARIGFVCSEGIIYLKARDIADIQKQLNKKESPWDVRIISVEVV